MASSEKQSKLESLLKVALNPIGSLALRIRVEKKSEVLIGVFKILSSATVTLTLSPCGYRLIESCLNAQNHDIDVRLGEVIGESWEGLEQMLLSLRGRHVCQTLLNRGLSSFALAAIKLTPVDWWFTNSDALPILIKAIEIADLSYMKELLADEKLVDNLCESAEGLYCVLRTMERSKDEPEFTDKFESMVLRISASLPGVNSLKDVIIYGDILAREIVNVICSRRESYNNGITHSLIIWIIRNGSLSMKEMISNCLCSPTESPLICSLRSSARYETLIQEYTKIFTQTQRDRLEECLAAHPVAVEKENGQPMDESVGAEKKKRRLEEQPTAASAAKKPREEVNDSPPTPSTATVSPAPEPTVTPASEPTVSPALKPTISPVPKPLVPSASKPTVPSLAKPTVLPSRQPTVSPSLSDPVIPVSHRIIHPRVTSPTVPRSVTVSPTGIVVTTAPTTTPVNTVTKSPLTSSTASQLVPVTVPPIGMNTVPPPTSTTTSLPTVSQQSGVSRRDGWIPRDEDSKVGLRERYGVTNMAIKIFPNGDRSSPQPNIDPGEDVISMAMSEKGKIILSRLDKGSMDFRSTIFSCIRSAIMALMMDEKGSRVVKWFLSNGTNEEKSFVERKIIDNVGDLVESGGYGRSFVRLIIDRCDDETKMKELEEKFAAALASPPMEDSSPSPPPIRCDKDDEIEILSERIAKRKEKTVEKEEIPPQFRALNEKFKQVEDRLKKSTLKYHAISSFISSKPMEEALVSSTSKDFAVKVMGREMNKWLDCQQGAKLVSALLQNKKWRLILATTMATHLHQLNDVHMTNLLYNLTRVTFMDACLKGGRDSPLVTLFSHGPKCLPIAKLLIVRVTKPFRTRVERFLSEHSRFICEYDGGRELLDEVLGTGEAVAQPIVRVGAGREKTTPPSTSSETRPVQAAITNPPHVSSESAVERVGEEMRVEEVEVPSPQSTQSIPQKEGQSDPSPVETINDEQTIDLSRSSTLDPNNGDSGKIPSLLDFSSGRPNQPVPPPPQCAAFAANAADAAASSSCDTIKPAVPVCSTQQVPVEASPAPTQPVDEPPVKRNFAYYRQQKGTTPLFGLPSAPPTSSSFSSFFSAIPISRSPSGTPIFPSSIPIPTPFQSIPSAPDFSFRSPWNIPKTTTRPLSFNDFVIDNVVKDIVAKMVDEVAKST